ncbi:MAG: hypothetical protein ACO1OG_04035 [Devosia sp.]
MKLDAKVKGGLAWAGLIVILAIPGANVLMGDRAATASTATAAVTTPVAATKPALTLPTAKPATTVDPVQTASTGEGAAVDKFVQSGKKLPSYISDADEVATAPAVKPTVPAVVPTAPVAAPTQVATVPAITPPIPLPRSARPATAVASLPAAQQPLIVEEPAEPFPLSDEAVVTGDQLEEWDSGSLAEYLESRGMLSGSSPVVEEDEFYVDQPPQRQRLDEFWLF